MVRSGKIENNIIKILLIVVKRDKARIGRPIDFPKIENVRCHRLRLFSIVIYKRTQVFSTASPYPPLYTIVRAGV